MLNSVYLVLLVLSCCLDMLKTQTPNKVFDTDQPSPLPKSTTQIAYYTNYEKALEEATNRSINREKNLQLIDELNFNNSDRSVLFIGNEFLDLSFKEFKDEYTGYNSTMVKKAPELYQGNRSLPKVNWDQEGYEYVTTSLNQRGCKNSYVFAAVACIESQHAIEQRYPPLEFSVSHAFRCEPTGSCQYGGSPDAVMQTIKDAGGPYLRFDYFEYNVTDGIKGPCIVNEKTKRRARVKIDKVLTLKVPDELSLMDVLSNYGPVVTTIQVTPEFMFYKEGVLTPKQCNDDGNITDYTDHAVLVYGYGKTKDNRKYWLVKNSWGRSWGDIGTFKLARDGLLCGFGMHYIATTVHSKVTPIYQLYTFSFSKGGIATRTHAWRAG